MIPKFPEFKLIELSDKNSVEEITSKFLPYSDFNFSNIWSWNIKGEVAFSIHNKNLIVRFSDYVNGSTFYSFIGGNMVNDTARDLIIFLQQNNKDSVLKLVPEETANLLDKTQFDIVADTDSNDYIYSVSQMATMNTWQQNSLSKGIRRFIKENPDYVIKQNLLSEISKDEYLDMYKKWAENKKIEKYFELNEYKAFENRFQINSKNTKVISLYLGETLIGFTIFEILNNGYAMSYFAKADITIHPSIYAVLNWEEAKILQKLGVEYYNWDQDLGIIKLRKSKMSYHPIKFLKKYRVSLLK